MCVFAYGHLINNILFKILNLLNIIICFYIICFSKYGISLVPSFEYEKNVFTTLLYFTYFEIAFLFFILLLKKASLKKRYLSLLPYFLLFFIIITSGTNFTKATFLSLSGQGDLRANINAKIWIWKYEKELDEILKGNNIQNIDYYESMDMSKIEAIPPVLLSFIAKSNIKSFHVENGVISCSLKTQNNNYINFSKGNSSLPKTIWYKIIVEHDSEWEYNLGNGWKIHYYDGRYA